MTHKAIRRMSMTISKTTVQNATFWAAALLCLGSSLPVSAQSSNEPDLKDRLIQVLSQQVDEKNNTIIILQKRIEELQRLDTLRVEKRIELERVVGEQKGIIAKYEDRGRLWLERITKEKELTANANKGIIERDKLITELSKPRKTSTWQKVAESVVPVVSIIAIAAAGGN